MPEIKVIDQNGKEVEKITLQDGVFNVPLKKHTISELVLQNLANRRQGTAKALDRGEVSGGGKKPWRQKGTGRARVGSIRSPLWRHGGVIHPPVPRDYSFYMPRKMKRLALSSILSEKLREGNIVVVNNISLEKYSTKTMKGLLGKIVSDRDTKNCLVILDAPDSVVMKSASNLPGVDVIVSNNISAHALLKAEKLIFTSKAIKQVEEVLSK